MTLSNLLSVRAKEFPKRSCIRFENRVISYSELNELVSKYAGGLNDLGLNDQDRVAILMHNCPEYIITYFSIIRAGGIAVPVNTFLTAQEISYIISDSECKILVYSNEFSKEVDQIKTDLSGLKTVKYFDISHRNFECSSGDNNDDDRTAVYLYTSGTTGFPKGAMLTHRNLISNAASSNAVMKITHRDKILLFLPLFHSFSFTVCVILPIFTGATIVLLKSVKPFSNVIKSIFRDRITFFVAVPTIYKILARKRIPMLMMLLLRLLINIRACVSGASALPGNTIAEFEKRFKVPLIEGYGLTEASPVVAVNPLYGVRKPLSVGPAVPGVEAMVVAEDGSQIRSGGTGELIVRGENVMKGYFRREDETKEVLKDGWLYTGDIAKIDEDGYIFIVDRKKDLIIVDGMNIYPREVEDLVEQHHAIEECAMVGIPDNRGSELSVLFMKKKEGTTVNNDSVRDYLKGRLAKFKLPRRFVFVTDFPKTATGKIKKNELKKWEF